MAEYLVQNESLTAIADAIRAKTGGTDTLTLAQMPEAIAGIRTSGTYQEKFVTPTGEQFDVLPDDGYDAMSKVTVEGDTALKPWNIPEGTTIYGVVGTAKLAVTTDPPADLPVSKDDADAALVENDATADISTFDLMVLMQDDGNITYCYLAKDTQTVPFEITSYDPITTEFKAKGWRRMSYHTTGVQSGMWTYDDFTDTESGGWNYLKNVRSCSREKLYYNGVEVWPENKVSPAILAAGNTWYNGTTEKDTITEIHLVDSYTPADPAAVTETWDASDASVPGTVTAYIEGTKLTLAGNGTGKIRANTDSSNAFADFSNVSSIDGLSILDTSAVTNMSSMFAFCQLHLTSLDLSSFNTSAVTDMNNMFCACNTLTTLDLSNFDTSAVTNMSDMFHACLDLTTLNVSSFNTSAVTDMNKMFIYCSALTSLDLSSFNTSAVTDMSGMFSYCSALTALDVSGFNTSAVTDMNNMFSYCMALTALDLSSFNTSAVTNMSSMFYACNALTTLNVSSFNTSAVTNMSSMFCECNTLTTLDLSNFDTSAVTDMSDMFYICSNLTTLNVSSFDTSAVTDMNNMFFRCSALTALDVSGFNTSAVTDMSGMFSYCSALTALDVSGFNTSAVTDIGGIFYECNALTILDVSGFDTSAVTEMPTMFYGCAALTSLDLSSFDTSAVTNFNNLFNGTALTTLDLSSFDTSAARMMGGMFKNMNHLEQITLGNKFSFTGKGITSSNYIAVLPTPSNSYIPGADGNWYNTADTAFAPADIPSNVADTYYAVLNRG